MKITDFRVIYICPDHNPKYHERKLHMDSLLTSLGFTRIEHYKSSTERYPDCLSAATIDILSKNLDEPFLLLEDDVEFTGVTDVTVEEGVDAIYLGLSRYGGSKTRNCGDGPAKFELHSVSQNRVMNMLATHAILYLSKRYKQAVINLLKARFGRRYHVDVLISRIQPHYRVLANKEPSFFQSAKFNNREQEHATRFTLL